VGGSPFVGSLAVRHKKDAAGPLLCHVGGTMRRSSKTGGTLQQETGQKIEINSADSGELMAHIELQAQGDLYVCHDPSRRDYVSCAWP
jgi:ABC-type molybdate transport system substrate-binding protein